jgi:hypothetical protein
VLFGVIVLPEVKAALSGWIRLPLKAGAQLVINDPDQFNSHKFFERPTVITSFKNAKT